MKLATDPPCLVYLLSIALARVQEPLSVACELAIGRHLQQLDRRS